MLFHLMPNSAFNKMGFKKADVINLCGTMAELDFSDSLHKVSCPVLIVCGEKDNANKKTAKELLIIFLAFYIVLQLIRVPLLYPGGLSHN